MQRVIKMQVVLDAIDKWLNENIQRSYWIKLRGKVYSNRKLTQDEIDSINDLMKDLTIYRDFNYSKWKIDRKK